uniref:Heme-binding protein 1 n=1 Tax=Poecilia mexicana TaxID=48701 RepID=A0A3B3YVY1_9TELE
VNVFSTQTLYSTYYINNQNKKQTATLTNGVGFEVRRYDAAKYAAVYSEGRTYEQVIGELKRLKPTKPLFALTRHQYPPAPTDSTIRVEERPGMTVYALYVSFVTFGGFAGESEYRAEAARLTRALGETTPFQRKQYFCCSYDPPLKPYGRRNEVWLLQEDP